MWKTRGAFAALLAVALAGCDLFGGGPEPTVEPPEITSFTASPTTISAPGQQVTLSWQLSGAVTSLTLDPGGLAVSGNSTTVNPTQSTTYTLTARNSAGSDNAQVPVTLDDGTTPPPPGPDATPPTGNFAVGPTANGPFTNDRAENITGPNDERVLQLEPGDSFFAQVSYSDPSGITDIEVRLVNRNPPGIAGTLTEGQSVSGFTLVGPVNSGCDLSSTPVSVTCVYQIDVGDDVVNIDQLLGAADEFAYVFRTYVTDAVNNTSQEPIRGYVVVGGASTPEPPEEPEPPAPEPPEEPEPPTPEPPEEPEGPVIESFTANGTADAITVEAGEDVTLAWTLSGAEPTAISLSVEEEGATPTLVPLEVSATSYEVEAVDETTSFTLIVEGPEGSTPAESVVTVNVEPGL